MGLLGSLIKATTKIALTPVAITTDLVTAGAFGFLGGEFLTEKLNKNLGSDINKISAKIEKL